jgi:hypothetical protein
MNVDTKHVSIRCEDNAEMVTFIRHHWYDGDKSYEILFEDAYCGGDYMGVKGRFKRAWNAFLAKPIYHTAIYCEDGKRMRMFLEDCLRIMEEDGD